MIWSAIKEIHTWQGKRREEKSRQRQLCKEAGRVGWGQRSAEHPSCGVPRAGGVSGAFVSFFFFAWPRKWTVADCWHQQEDMESDGSQCRRSESRCRDGEVCVLGNSCLHNRGSGAQTAGLRRVGGRQIWPGIVVALVSKWTNGGWISLKPLD